MISAKLQGIRLTHGIKIQLCLYTTAMNNPKRKLRRFHLQQKESTLLIESKRIKYLGINLAWEIQDYYTTLKTGKTTTERN